MASKKPPGEGGLAFLGKRSAPPTGGLRGYADGPPACRYGHVQSEPDSAPSVGLIAEWRPLAAAADYADQVPSSPGRLWSKGSRSAGAEAGRSKGEGGSTERSSCWGGPRAGARSAGRMGRSRCSRIWRTTGGSVRNRRSPKARRRSASPHDPRFASVPGGTAERIDLVDPGQELGPAGAGPGGRGRAIRGVPAGVGPGYRSEG